MWMSHTSVWSMLVMLNLLDKNINTIQKSIRTLLHASKEIDLAVKKQVALSMVHSKTF